MKWLSNQDDLSFECIHRSEHREITVGLFGFFTEVKPSSSERLKLSRWLWFHFHTHRSADLASSFCSPATSSQVTPPTWKVEKKSIVGFNMGVHQILKHAETGQITSCGLWCWCPASPQGSEQSLLQDIPAQGPGW